MAISRLPKPTGIAAELARLAQAEGSKLAAAQPAHLDDHERDVIARLLGHLMHPAATHEVVEDLRFLCGDDGDIKAVRARIGGEMQQVTAALHRDDLDGLTPVPAEARKAVDRLLPEVEEHSILGLSNPGDPLADLQRRYGDGPGKPKFASGGIVHPGMAVIGGEIHDGHLLNRGALPRLGLSADWSGYSAPSVPQAEIDRRVSLAIRHLAAALGTEVTELLGVEITREAVIATVAEPRTADGELAARGLEVTKTRRGATYTYRPTGWKQTKGQDDE